MSSVDERETRHNQRHSEDEDRGLESVARDSSINWAESNQDADELSQRGTEYSSKHSGATTFGGMLRQLRRLQQAHLAYVEAHGDRLEKRLQENREHKQQVIDDMERLERQIVELMEKEETGNSPLKHQTEISDEEDDWVERDDSEE